MPELYEQSTESLLSALNAGDLSSRTLTTACLDRIDQLNKKLNAFVSVNADAALAKADAVDKRRATGQTIGLLQGLPVGVKDNICQAGVATRCGSRMLHNYCPPYDAHVVEQLNAEDGVIVGQ